MRVMTLLLIGFSLLGQPVASIRSKISAGDLASAASVLEVHKAEKGEDNDYLEGLSWLARGAALTQDWSMADQISQQLRILCEPKLKANPDLDKEDSLRAALGALLEVEAQVIASRKSRDAKKMAIKHLQTQLDRFPKPISLRSRIYKRINQLSLEGQSAPEILIDETLLAGFKSVAASRSQPLLIFGWAHWCGDCRAQAAALGKIYAEFQKKVQFLALTRFYDSNFESERQAISKVWTASYKGLEKMPMVSSNISMERYGVSSTPTFILIDSDGKVFRYMPSRLTETTLRELLQKVK
jgi:thiol-disulfide isomerase/thioredoxin